MRYIVRRQIKVAGVVYPADTIIEISAVEYAAWLRRNMGPWLEAVEAAPPPVETHMAETRGPGVEVHVARPARRR